MTAKQAKELRALLEKYYDGTTSCADEEAMHRLLRRADVPAEFAIDKALFSFWRSEQRSKTSKAKLVHRLRPWMAAAAVGLLLLGVGAMRMLAEPQSYAYINGERITAPDALRTAMAASLVAVSSERNEVDDALRQLW
ncbi:MAG: hypothetical protein LBS94_04285 [Prevotellaceae bacterium]|jgi:hypothetical protein|nr:hypothetical protein [Prevotellaceae bacterium]